MPTINGTPGNDTLTGSAGSDTMIGGLGNDIYNVNSLANEIVETNATGSGVDTIRTAVLDALRTYSLEWWAYVENLSYTGTQAAQLKGNELGNVIQANAAVVANDTLYGAGGNDALSAYGGDDSLMGGSGDDTLDGGAGTDFMIGGTGNDRYLIDSLADRAFEYVNGGFDTIVTTVAKDLRVSWAAQIEGLLYNATNTQATLLGNALGNMIESRSATADVLYGYAGDDTLAGGNGTDTLVGGTGNDFYWAVSAADVATELVGEGTDTFVGAKTDLRAGSYATTMENLFYTPGTGASLFGNAMANLVSGGAGNDIVDGGDGNDTLLGGVGGDSLSGGNGDDVLYGASNPDYVWLPNRKLLPDLEADTLVGGAGNDRYLIDRANDLVTELAGGGTLDVVISANDNSLAFYANVEALVLQRDTTAWFGEGTAGNDILVGNQRDNYLVGGLGNDILSGVVDYGSIFDPKSDALDAGGGDDVLLAFDYGVSYALTREISLYGGSGNDLYVLGSRLGTYGGYDTGGTDTVVMTESGSIAQLEGVENIFLYGADAGWDTATRNAIQTVFAAANGPTAVYTGFIGNAYNATGNDLGNRIWGNDLANALTGGGGADSITGYGGNDTLEGGTGIDTLVGGAGDDLYYLDTGDVAVEAAGQGFDTLASLTISSFTGYANFEGLQYLGATAVNLNRGSTNTSADFLGGGSGNDTVSGYGGNDTLDGGAGNDTVDGGTGNDSLRGGIGNDSVLGADGNDSVDGGDGGDTLRGALGDDTMDGGAGDDALDGGGNWDTIAGGAGNDSATGGDGRDFIDGGVGNDVLYGEANDDILVGGAGIDELRGGAAAAEGRIDSHGDRLWGDEQYGTGGGQSDLFVFDTVLADNGATETFNGSGVYEFVDGATICDYESGLDAIFLSATFGGAATIGDGDLLLEGTVTTTSAGQAFSAAAELVLVRANVADLFATTRSAFFSDIDAAAVDAVIGNASAAMAVGASKIFVVDDGSNSAVFLFQSNNGDAAVTIDELYLLTVVNGQAALGTADFALF